MNDNKNLNLKDKLSLNLNLLYFCVVIPFDGHFTDVENMHQLYKYNIKE